LKIELNTHLFANVSNAGAPGPGDDESGFTMEHSNVIEAKLIEFASERFPILVPGSRGRAAKA
jgi:hypothetical protein